MSVKAKIALNKIKQVRKILFKILFTAIEKKTKVQSQFHGNKG